MGVCRRTMATVADGRLKEQQSETATSNSAAGAATVSADKAQQGEACQPLYPPTPMIGHLTNEEIEALNDVFSRMELFEAEETARIRYRPYTPTVIHVNVVCSYTVYT